MVAFMLAMLLAAQPGDGYAPLMVTVIGPDGVAHTGRAGFSESTGQLYAVFTLDGGIVILPEDMPLQAVLWHWPALAPRPAPATPVMEFRRAPLPPPPRRPILSRLLFGRR